MGTSRSPQSTLALLHIFRHSIPHFQHFSSWSGTPHSHWCTSIPTGTCWSPIDCTHSHQYSSIPKGPPHIPLALIGLDCCSYMTFHSPYTLCSMPCPWDWWFSFPASSSQCGLQLLYVILYTSATYSGLLKWHRLSSIPIGVLLWLDMHCCISFLDSFPLSVLLHQHKCWAAGIDSTQYQLALCSIDRGHSILFWTSLSPVVYSFLFTYTPHLPAPVFLHKLLPFCIEIYNHIAFQNPFRFTVI